MTDGQVTTRTTPRQRILDAAAILLADGGRDAVTTRSVGAAAGVQAATIYRQFGDMRGLLEAVAARGFEQYLARKTRRRRAADPVVDLRRGWDLHVEFGLGHPALYALMYGEPRPGARPHAAVQADAVLRGLVAAVAAAGRLRVPVEDACRVISATGVGVVLTLLAEEESRRELRLSALTRDAVIDAFTTSTASIRPETAGLRSHAIAVRALLGEADDRFTPGERTLLGELLHRLA